MSNKKICGIYMIRNIANDKKYIGLSRDCYGRISRHKTNLKHNKHSNCHLQAAWNKYGWQMFEFLIIEECCIDSLPEREIYWIKYYDSFKNGYNRSGGGDGTTDAILSPERNKLISIALTGRARNNLRGKDSPNARSVVCLNDGKHFACIKDASDKYSIHYEGIVRSCATGCTVGDDMLVFSYEEDYNQLTHDDLLQRLETAINARVIGKPSTRIVCLNTGETFISAKDAASRFGLKTITNIHKCCKGQCVSSGISAQYEPLVWVYEHEYKSMTLEEIQAKIDVAQKQSTKRYKVVCVETGEVFTNATLAAKHFGISNVTLSTHLRNTGAYQKQMQNGEIRTFKIA